MSDVEQVESKIPLDELVNTYLKIRNKKRCSVSRV